jgi:excisionase family DNA binding protein
MTYHPNDAFIAVDLHPEVVARRVSRSSVYRMVRDNRIPHARVGRKLFVLRDFLGWLAAQGDNK